MEDGWDGLGLQDPIKATAGVRVRRYDLSEQRTPRSGLQE